MSISILNIHAKLITHREMAFLTNTEYRHFQISATMKRSISVFRCLINLLLQIKDEQINNIFISLTFSTKIPKGATFHLPTPHGYKFMYQCRKVFCR